MTQSVRVSEELIESARVVATLSSRSLSGQIEQWARIGRAIERTPGFDYVRVEKALKAELSPDGLTNEEQALFYDEFFALMEHPSKEELQFFGRMKEAGLGVGLDENDKLVYGENELKEGVLRPARLLSDDEITSIAAQGAREGRQAAFDAGLSVMNEVDGKDYLFHPDGSRELLEDEK